MKHATDRGSTQQYVQYAPRSYDVHAVGEPGNDARSGTRQPVSVAQLELVAVAKAQHAAALCVASTQA